MTKRGEKQKRDDVEQSVLKQLEKQYGRETTQNPDFRSFVAALVQSQVRTT